MTIYTIYKATNKIDGKSYIGFDSNYPIRQYTHYRKSKQKNNIYFYNAIRKYGWGNFTWEILYQSKEKDHTLKIMENYFICEYNTYTGFDNCNGYNMTLGGEGSRGYKHTPETLAYCSKLSLGVPRPDLIKIVSCKLYDPSGNLHVIDNLREFCEKHSLRYQSMISILSNKRSSNYGWLKYEDGLSYEQTKAKYCENNPKIKFWKFYDKNGEELFIYNLYDYCIKNNLTKISMMRVHEEKLYSYKGYIKYIDGLTYEECIERNNIIRKEKEILRAKSVSESKNRTYVFLDPDNNVIETNNLTQFCKNNNLCLSEMYNVTKYPDAIHKNYKNVNTTRINNEIKVFEFIDPEGNYIKTNNLSEFCNDNNLSYDKMYRVSRSKTYEYESYRNINHKPIEQKTYTFIDPDNNTIEITNLPDYCRKNNLRYDKMVKLFKGKQKSHKGYRNINNKDWIPYHEREYVLINPKGKEIKIKDINSFCKKHDLSKSGLISVINGHEKSYKGYKLPKNKNFVLAKDRNLCYKFIDPFNNKIEITNLPEYCRTHGIGYSNMLTLHTGRSKSAYGYRKWEEN